MSQVVNTVLNILQKLSLELMKRKNILNMTITLTLKLDT